MSWNSFLKELYKKNKEERGTRRVANEHARNTIDIENFWELLLKKIEDEKNKDEKNKEEKNEDERIEDEKNKDEKNKEEKDEDERIEDEKNKDEKLKAENLIKVIFANNPNFTWKSDLDSNGKNTIKIIDKKSELIF
jgi:hypothetical protein